MNVRSLKLAGAAAGMLFLVGASSNVYAQTTDVLSMANHLFNYADNNNNGLGSVFTFTGPLILTQVGFTMDSTVTPTFRYQINNGNPIPVTFLSTTVDSYNVAWHTLLNPVQLNTGDYVTLFNDDENRNIAVMISAGGSPPGFIPWTSTNPSVTYTGFGSFNPTGSTVGNIRVSPSNPGSNVAPEPGSIALFITGGGALAGIALRRRHNAA